MTRPDLMEEAPVAWRLRANAEQPWQYRDFRNHAADMQGWQQEPLYSASALAAAEARGREEAAKPRPLDEYHEDIGNVLWWHYPVQEPPYVGSALDTGFDPEWHQWWTPLPDPSGNATHEAIAAAIRRGTP